MQATNFNNYLTAFQIISSRFDAAIDNIHEMDIREEMYECRMQNINRLHTNLNAALQSDVEIYKRKEKDYAEEDFDDCISRLKSIAISGKREKRLAEQEELEEKLNILDKAALLKHYTSSVVAEVDDQLIGVMLSKASGKAETIFVPRGERPKDLLKQIRDLNGTPIE